MAKPKHNSKTGYASLGVDDLTESQRKESVGYVPGVEIKSKKKKDVAAVNATHETSDDSTVKVELPQSAVERLEEMRVNHAEPAVGLTVTRNLPDGSTETIEAYGLDAEAVKQIVRDFLARD